MRRPGIQAAAVRVATGARPTTSMDFGANFGGPIQDTVLYHGTSKHHSFFYFDWEAFHRRRLECSHSLDSFVLERGGNFTDWKDSSGNLILFTCRQWPALLVKPLPG